MPLVARYDLAAAARGWSRDAGLEAAPGRVLRFRVPEGRTVVVDRVRGEVEFDNSTIEDFVLLRGNDIDITSRLKPYVSPAGIAIPNALVPPGKFVLQVAVSDGSDRRTTANVEINAQ